MVLPEDGCLLRIFIGESEKVDGKPLYQRLVEEARGSGLVFWCWGPVSGCQFITLLPGRVS